MGVDAGGGDAFQAADTSQTNDAPRVDDAARGGDARRDLIALDAAEFLSCASDDDCVTTWYPQPVTSAADCYCRACAWAPVNRTTDATFSAAWMQYCADWLTSPDCSIPPLPRGAHDRVRVGRVPGRNRDRPIRVPGRSEQRMPERIHRLPRPLLRAGRMVRRDHRLPLRLPPVLRARPVLRPHVPVRGQHRDRALRRHLLLRLRPLSRRAQARSKRTTADQRALPSRRGSGSGNSASGRIHRARAGSGPPRA